MTQYIDKDALVAEIENQRKHYIERDDFDNGWNFALDKIISLVDTLEVKEVDISNVSENLAEANEYLSYTHTSNLAHNKPMIATRLRRAIKELYNAGLFQLTHDEKYRMENLGLKAQKGEVV